MKTNNCKTVEVINHSFPFIPSVRKKKNKSPITPREAECLSWAAVGKTANEIAEMLNISEHTIHFHTKNAIKKLAANNITHAVAKAILSKYIVVS